MIETRTSVTVFCDRFQRGGLVGPDCIFSERLHFDHVPTTEEMAEALKAAEYVVDEDGRHWCPRHADRGEVMRIETGYQEIAPGVHVRLPSMVQTFAFIEVKRVTA